MKIDIEKIDSKYLGQEIEVRIYGSGGRSLLVFPPQCGKARDFEGFGMIDSIRPFITEGQVQAFCVGSVDAESWAGTDIPMQQRGKRHEQYDQAVVKEVLPLIRGRNNFPLLRPITCGCSMGGYHAGNFFFRHPDLFGGLISLSGIFDLSMFVGDYCDDFVYFNSPLRFLANLNDSHYLSEMRQGQIVVCVGQGAWDEIMRDHASRLREVLRKKEIPAWIDFWGFDVNHDWPWWQKQLPYFLGRMELLPDKQRSRIRALNP